jgi:hypothetical protein
LPELLRHVPKRGKFLFKLLEPQHHTAVRSFFSRERVNAFVSCTAAPGKHYAAANGVTVSGTLDSACLKLYAGMGHSREELKGYFKREQALSFKVYEEGSPWPLMLHIPESREDTRDSRRL